MNAVLAWARLDLRRRWPSLLVLTLLVAVSTGVVLTALAGARRTDTAVPRLEARTLVADVMVLPNRPDFDWDAVRRLPVVETLGTFILPLGASADAGKVDLGNDEGFPPGDTALDVTVDRPALSSGRQADPNRADEAVANADFVKRFGRVFTMQFPTKAQADATSLVGSSPAGFKPAGRTLTIHIVGIGVDTFGLGAPGPQFEPTYGYFRDFMRPVYRYFANARLRLRGGEAGVPEFRWELAALTHNQNIDVVDWHQYVQSTQDAASFAATGWLLFCLTALLASLVLIGQAMMRFCAASITDLRTLEALGMDRWQAWGGAISGPAMAGLAGTLLGVAGAVLASPMFPTGVVRPLEPAPGVYIDLAVLGAGGVALLTLVLLGSGVAAVLATRVRDAVPHRPSVVAATAARSGVGPVVVLGTRFALEPGRGRSRVPVRPALIGVVAGVLGVVGALTFRTGLDEAIKDPARFGQTLPLGGMVAFNGAPTPQQTASINHAAHDPAIASFDDMRVAIFAIQGRQVSTFSLSPLAGQVRVVALSGRPPQTADEISVGPTVAQALHLHVGDQVTLGAKTLRISGVTFVPEDHHNGYADGAWLTGPGFSAQQPETKDKYHEVRFALKPNVDQDAATVRLSKDLGEIGPAPVPQAQANLASVRLQPLLLGGFLLLLALGAVGHALAAAVRRRRHDVAVLRALGMTRRQSRLIVAMQATVLAAVGVLFGLPMGVAAGRTAWRTLAEATPVIYVAPLAVLVLAIAVPATVAVANLLAVLPAWRAARLKVAHILRAE